jgi:hypothetical protein
MYPEGDIDTMLKFCRPLGLVAVLSFPQLMVAAHSFPPQALGQIEATGNFCAGVDAPWADKYKQAGKALAAVVSEKELKETRESSDYKAAYDATTGRLEKLPQDKAVEGCRARLRNDTKK